MSKKLSKSEELIEALSDQRVIKAIVNIIRDELINDLNEKIECKFKELKTELTADLTSMLENPVKKITSEVMLESLNPVKQDITKLHDRITLLESREYQNDLFICGLEANDAEKNEAMIDLVIRNIHQDLKIKLDHKDINFAYRTRKPDKPNQHPPILVSFTSALKRNEILQTVRIIRKQQLKPPYPQQKIYYNERLNKINSELAYIARDLQRKKKILSTWIFRGEVYIRKEQASKPQRILNQSELTKYE